VLGNEIGMGTEAVAGAFDLDDDRVVEEAIEKGGGDYWVAEEVGRFGEAAVRGEDHGALFLSCRLSPRRCRVQWPSGFCRCLVGRESAPPPHER
jgi:hypothetical protein